MSDTMTPVFWLAFIGLSLGLMGLLALIHVENQNGQRRLRLRRANGSEIHQTRKAEDAPRGLLRSTSTRLRHIVILMGERLSVVLGGESRETAAELVSAGYRGRDALLIFAFMKTLMPMLTLVVGAVWLLLSYPVGLDMLVPGAVVIAIALALSKAVDMFVNLRRKARMEAIRIGFPDLLELLVISAEAGLGPQPALHRVAHEMSLTHPELAQEVLQLVSEMAMTNDRRAAYDGFNARVPLPEITVFTQTLDQSDRYGTPFSRAIRTLMAEQRGNRLTAVEEKAARLPVLMTLPLIFCIMPAVFVVLIGPAALSVFDNILAGG